MTRSARPMSGPTVAGAAALLIVLAVTPGVSAAQVPDPGADARFHFGPLALSPTLAIKEIGVDSNVFNSPNGPIKDFTWTVGPGVVGAIRLDRARIGLSSTVDAVFFATHPAQNSINQRHVVQVDVALARVRPFVALDVTKTRARPGFEIDARARRTEPVLRGGVDLQFSTRTTVGFSARRSVTRFAPGEQFAGTDLGRTLNRSVDALGGSFRYGLTPLTTLVVLGEFERTRFDAMALRDANSFRLAPGFEFSPDALVRGKASLGYRRFDALGQGVPGYTGLVASAELTTVVGDTRFELRLDRDVAYSFEAQTPYYVQTGFHLTGIQPIFGPLDASGVVGWQRLAYRVVEGAPVADRVDRVATFGAGVGFRLGQGTRVGINAEHADRRSSAPDGRPFDRVRIFATVTYAFR